MVIGYTYNVRHTKPGFGKEAQDEAEFDEPQTIETIAAAIRSFGHTVILIEANERAYAKLYKHRKELDLVFNIAEGLHGDIREAQIPAMLEMLKIPYTHSSALTHAISLDKQLTKEVWMGHHLPTPKFINVPNDGPVDFSSVAFPLVVKPNAEGSSKGIFDGSVVENEKEAKAAIKKLRTIIHGDIFLEEFLEGREFTITMMGNDGIGKGVVMLPPVEQNYAIFPDHMKKLASYEAKWFFEDNIPNPHDAYICPPNITPTLYKELETLCTKAYIALECRDIARIDLRLDKNGKPSLLEINTIPGMIPDPNIVSYYPVAARTLGWSFEDMVGNIIKHALERTVSR